MSHTMSHTDFKQEAVVSIGPLTLEGDVLIIGEHGQMLQTLEEEIIEEIMEEVMF